MDTAHSEEGSLDPSLADPDSSRSASPAPGDDSGDDAPKVFEKTITPLIYGEILCATTTNVTCSFKTHGSAHGRTSAIGNVYVTNYRFAFEYSRTSTLPVAIPESSSLAASASGATIGTADPSPSSSGAVFALEPRSATAPGTPSEERRLPADLANDIINAKSRPKGFKWKLKTLSAKNRKGGLKTALLSDGRCEELLSADDVLPVGARGFEIPLGLIASVEKVGGHRSIVDAYGLAVIGKDNRSFFIGFSLDRHVSNERRHLFDVINCGAFPVTFGRTPFAFLHRSPEVEETGWRLYDPTAEYTRIGVPNATWRLSRANARYELSDTYPALLAVPQSVTDGTLVETAHFRKKGRIPALSWLHPKTGASLTRCSQPKVGMLGKRCEGDEALLSAVSHANAARPDTLCIMDARPYKNAMANQAMGAGTENLSFYENTELQFLDIENIHVMRDSLRRLCDRRPDADWLHHVGLVLSGARKIVRLMCDNSASCLVHCSDGWDRTPQLTSLSMLCMDPYYRTIRGYAILIEKEWLSFGHKFATRCGHGVRNPGDDQRSPVFVQFIDATWQLLRQYPRAFEFSEKFLALILDELHSGRYGTFMHDTEKARVESDLDTTTRSLWTSVSTPEGAAPYLNANYASADADVIVPDTTPKALKVWTRYYMRDDDHAVDWADFERGSSDRLLQLRNAFERPDTPANEVQSAPGSPGALRPVVSRAHSSSALVVGSARSSLRSIGADGLALDTSAGAGALYERLREGYLVKQGGAIKTWKRRWFVLDEESGVFNYYKQQGDKAPVGTIDLSACTDVTLGERLRGGEVQFKIATPARTYVIQAESARYAQSWVNSVKEVVDKRRGKKEGAAAK
eukprot:Opistho-1_new@70005